MSWFSPLMSSHVGDDYLHLKREHKTLLILGPDPSPTPSNLFRLHSNRTAPPERVHFSPLFPKHQVSSASMPVVDYSLYQLVSFLSQLLLLFQAYRYWSS